MSSAFRYLPHYTVKDYETWEGDWELWQGIPVAMTPSPFGTHQRVAKNLVVEIDNQLRSGGCNANVLYEFDWIVTEDTVLRPDVLVICGETPDKHLESTPALIAEIQSESTAHRDREAKRDLYEEQAVSVYLLIDPEKQMIEIFSRDESGRWQSELVNESAAFWLCGDCHLTIEKREIFR